MEQKFKSLKEMFDSDMVQRNMPQSYKEILETRYNEYKNGEDHYTSDIEKINYDHYPTAISYIFRNAVTDAVINIIDFLEDDSIFTKLSKAANDYCDCDDHYPVETLKTQWDMLAEVSYIYTSDLSKEEMNLGDFRMVPVDLKTKEATISTSIFYKEEELVITMQEYGHMITLTLILDGELIAKIGLDIEKQNKNKSKEQL